MRKLLALSALAGAALMTAAGSPPPGSSVTNPATRTICLDSGGRSHVAVCQVPGSRLDRSEDICICRMANNVEAPVCGPGEKAPAETLAYEKARKVAAEDQSLVGDLYEGRPMCVEPRNP